MADPATVAELRKEMGEKVEIPVPEGCIPVHAPLVDGTATVAVPGGAALAAPGDLERLRESLSGAERSEQELVMSTMADEVAVVRLPPDASVPYWADDSVTPLNYGTFYSVTRTPHELQIITSFADVPATEQREGPWTAFMVRGRTLTFTLEGILEDFDTVFYSTDEIGEETDYVLVPSADAEKARSALTASGWRFADA